MKNFSGKKNSVIYTAAIILAVIAILVVFFSVANKSGSTVEAKAIPPQDAAVAVSPILLPQAAPHSNITASLGNGWEVWL